MSLESQIGSLVEAANNLTGTVAGKMGEIDGRVDDLSSEFAEVLRQRNSVDIYVDQANGDDNNSGISASSPLKSLVEVTERMLPSSAYRIFITGDYLLQSGKELYPPQATSVWLRGRHGGRLILAWDGTMHESSGHTNGSIDMSTGSELYFENLALDLDESSIDAMYQTGEVFTRNCLVRTNSGVSANTMLRVRFNTVDFSAATEKMAAFSDAYPDQPSMFFSEVMSNAGVFVFRRSTHTDEMEKLGNHFFRDSDSSDAAPLYVMTNSAVIFRD